MRKKNMGGQGRARRLYARRQAYGTLTVTAFRRMPREQRDEILERLGRKEEGRDGQ